MLRHLHVQNVALIEDLTLEVGPALTVFTGETGAGKSILLDALALLTGPRATPSLVRSGEERATVEAYFDAENSGRVTAWLAEHGLESGEPGEVILRRDVQASGRSRAWINGRLVPISQLGEVSSLLLVLHGQHEQQTLLEAGTQRDFLDEFNGLEDQCETVRRAYRRLTEALADLNALRGEERDREQRMDFLRFQIEELEGLNLKAGELESLQEEKERLAHIEDLTEQGQAARVILSEGTPEQASVADLLGSASANLEGMAKHDVRLRTLVESLGEAVARVDDVGRELSGYVESLEGDPARLSEVQERIEAIRRALRKHGPTESEALVRLEELKAELATLENLETARAEREARVAGCRAELARTSSELSESRMRAKKGFLRPFGALLKDFGMEDVRVDLQVRPIGRGVEVESAGGPQCGPEGREEVEILFSANKGEGLQPLRKVASGGELSRIMLALRSLSAQKGDVPVLVFDEIDAGISGTAVGRVAERLATLGERHQVLYVTHQPALAGVAHTHWMVKKQIRNGRTRTVLAQAEGRDRQEEVARLLGDGSPTKTSLALAAEILQTA